MKPLNKENGPETYFFEGDGRIPNSVLPVLVYRGAVPENRDLIEEVFTRNGWPIGFNAVRGFYPFQHYHSNAHEVIGIASGEVEGQIGGPKGRDMTLRAGDVIVLPAGVGHYNLNWRGEFLMTGGFVSGMEQLYNVHRDDPAEYQPALMNIARVPVPVTDPVFGADGPLPSIWNEIWNGQR